MNRQIITKFLVFAILFAGTIEAAAPVDKSSDDKITVSGSYNPFTVSSCSTTDRYVQGSAKINYDKRFHKNWEFHSAAVYSRSKRISHEYDPDDDKQYDPPLPEYKNSGYGDIGFSFWWDYLRIRADFTLFVYDTYQEEYRGNTFIGINKKVNVLPMGGGLIEAGKMDFMWISTGSLHHEYPYGLLQVALNGNIKNKAELGGGVVLRPLNHTMWLEGGKPFSLFLRTKVKVTDFFAIKSYISISPIAFPEEMFEGSLGMEFSF
ncbi:MAG TPA: hypothetical protein VLJ60_10250 [bacterium]|nr:hypothetical protein [bacterium]